MEKITQCETSNLVLFKSSRIKWTNQRARVRDKGGNPYMIFVSKYERIRRLGNFGEDSRKSLNEILRLYCVELWIGLMWLRIGTSGGILSTVMNKYYIFPINEGA
jgi:hypothetical protein